MTQPPAARKGQRVFDSFGKIVSETNAATGQQNNLHRWYDPAVGRWLSEDPIGFAERDANVSRYVSNSPLTKVDPSGLWPGLGGDPTISASSMYRPTAQQMATARQQRAERFAKVDRVFKDFHLRCSDYAYYEATGIDGFVNEIRKTLRDFVTDIQEDSSFWFGAGAKWDTGSRVLELGGKIDGNQFFGLLEELTHALDQQKNGISGGLARHCSGGSLITVPLPALMN